MRMVAQTNLGNSPDHKQWAIEKDGIFLVKSYYKQITMGLAAPVLDFQYKQVWKTNAPVQDKCLKYLIPVFQHFLDIL